MLWEALRVARCAQLVLQATHARLVATSHGATAHGAHLGTFALAGTWAPARAKVPRSPRDPSHRTIRLPPRTASWAYTSVYTVRLNRNGVEVAWASSHDAAHEELTRAPLLALLGISPPGLC